MDSNKRITSIEDDVIDLLFWILGIFVTLVGGLIGAFAYLGKIISDGLRLVVAPPEQSDPVSKPIAQQG